MCFFWRLEIHLFPRCTLSISSSKEKAENQLNRIFTKECKTILRRETYLRAKRLKLIIRFWIDYPLKWHLGVVQTVSIFRVKLDWVSLVDLENSPLLMSLSISLSRNQLEKTSLISKILFNQIHIIFIII